MPEWNRLSDIHLWDLNENSTRFDQASASPSFQELQIQWIGTATISSIVAFFNLLLMISILRVKEVRNKSFNCYILAVLFPDFQFSLSCAITCSVNAVKGLYVGEAMCGWQSWYAVFGFAASCWMNAVISHQLYTMLKVSHFRGRYIPPTITHVAKQTLIVYGYAACLASLGTWKAFGLPFKAGIYQGYACLIKDYDDASTIFFWLGFLPLCVLIPLVYVLSCIIRIVRGGMLPPPGQRTTLWMYFSLIFVFVFMWLPFIIITFVYGPASPTVDSTWVLWVGAQFSHLQGLATVWTILFKKDIRAAFCGTITCGRYKGKFQQTSSQHGSRSNNSSGMLSRTRRLTYDRNNSNENTSNSNARQSFVTRDSRMSSLQLESIVEILGMSEPLPIPTNIEEEGETEEEEWEENKPYTDVFAKSSMRSSLHEDIDPELRGHLDFLNESDEEKSSEMLKSNPTHLYIVKM